MSAFVKPRNTEQDRLGLTSNSVNALDLESSTLQRINEEAQRSRRIGTREDVFVHEQSPDEILILPRFPETSNLQEKDAIILEHVINLAQEGAEMANTDVLGHLQAGNLVVLSRRDGSVTVIGADNARLRLRDAITEETRVTPGGLVLSESDTGDMSAVVLGGKACEGSPSAAEIKHAVTLLEANLGAHDLEFVVLKLLERLFLMDVRDNTRSVNHAGAQEPGVEVVASIVMIADLLLVFTVSSATIPFQLNFGRAVKTYLGSCCE